jgi:uncharacterized ubiquitin-like protein YukD
MGINFSHWNRSTTDINLCAHLPLGARILILISSSSKTKEFRRANGYQLKACGDAYFFSVRCHLLARIYLFPFQFWLSRLSFSIVTCCIMLCWLMTGHIYNSGPQRLQWSWKVLVTQWCQGQCNITVQCMAHRTMVMLVEAALLCCHWYKLTAHTVMYTT